MQDIGGSSIGAAIDRMRSAYARRDTEAFLCAYERAAAESHSLRAAIRLLERVYPLESFLRLAHRLNWNLAERGLHEGCRAFLDEASLPWERVLPASCQAIAESGPVVFYGNHPSLLTPFLVAASIDRDDLRYFSTSYVCHLIPSFGDVSYRMEVPLTRWYTEWRRGGWRRALAYRLVALVHDMPDPKSVKHINRLSLASGADHVRRGGCVMICPGGGGTRDRYWYPGIGSLVKVLREGSVSKEAFLIPVREENSTNQRIYAQLLRRPIDRPTSPADDRGPVRILFADPIPVREIAVAASSVEQIAELLRSQYEALFAATALAPR